eukprot:363199-Chlamydomonas_euryale.AAC.1
MKPIGRRLASPTAATAPRAPTSPPRPVSSCSMTMPSEKTSPDAHAGAPQPCGGGRASGAVHGARSTAAPMGVRPEAAAAAAAHCAAPPSASLATPPLVSHTFGCVRQGWGDRRRVNLPGMLQWLAVGDVLGNVVGEAVGEVVGKVVGEEVEKRARIAVPPHVSHISVCWSCVAKREEVEGEKRGARKGEGDRAAGRQRESNS